MPPTEKNPFELNNAIPPYGQPRQPTGNPSPGSESPFSAAVPTAPVWPEQMPTYQPYTVAPYLASLGERFLAYAIDRVIVIVGGYATIFALGFMVAIFSPDAIDGASNLTLDFIGLLGLFIVNAIYFIFFMLLTNGSTPGKMLFGLRVVRRDDRPLNAVDIFLRCGVGYYLSSIFMLGFLTAFGDHERQAWHDKFIDSLVVKNPPQPAPPGYPY